MKKIRPSVTFAALLLALFIFNNCGGGPTAPTPRKKVQQMLVSFSVSPRAGTTTQAFTLAASSEIKYTDNSSSTADSIVVGLAAGTVVARGAGKTLNRTLHFDSSGEKTLTATFYHPDTTFSRSTTVTVSQMPMINISPDTLSLTQGGEGNFIIKATDPENDQLTITVDLNGTTTTLAVGDTIFTVTADRSGNLPVGFYAVTATADDGVSTGSATATLEIRLLPTITTFTTNIQDLTRIHAEATGTGTTTSLTITNPDTITTTTNTHDVQLTTTPLKIGEYTITATTKTARDTQTQTQHQTIPDYPTTINLTQLHLPTTPLDSKKDTLTINTNKIQLTEPNPEQQNNRTLTITATGNTTTTTPNDTTYKIYANTTQEDTPFTIHFTTNDNTDTTYTNTFTKTTLTDITIQTYNLTHLPNIEKITTPHTITINGKNHQTTGDLTLSLPPGEYTIDATIPGPYLPQLTSIHRGTTLESIAHKDFKNPMTPVTINPTPSGNDTLKIYKLNTADIESIPNEFFEPRPPDDASNPNYTYTILANTLQANNIRFTGIQKFKKGPVVIWYDKASNDTTPNQAVLDALITVSTSQGRDGIQSNFNGYYDITFQNGGPEPNPPYIQAISTLDENKIGGNVIVVGILERDENQQMIKSIMYFRPDFTAKGNFQEDVWQGVISSNDFGNNLVDDITNQNSLEYNDFATLLDRVSMYFPVFTRVRQ